MSQVHLPIDVRTTLADNRKVDCDTIRVLRSNSSTVPKRLSLYSPDWKGRHEQRYPNSQHETSATHLCLSTKG